MWALKDYGFEPLTASTHATQQVCGENRIGIFAKEDMDADTEVVYDYLYETTDENKYVPL
jgi:hypothetical protein